MKILIEDYWALVNQENFNIMTEEEKEVEKLKYVYGWKDAQDVANSVWGTIHESLLRGQLVFAYRNLGNREKSGSGLYQLVISRNYSETGLPLNEYNVGYIITNSYTALLPRMPLEYLKTELKKYINSWKLEKEAIESFDNILKRLE